jgi:hypothetical protein
MRSINYFNSQGEFRSVSFAQVIKQWIDFNGGIVNFNNELNKLNWKERETIHLAFIVFFSQKYNCELPDVSSPYFQIELYSNDLYYRALNEFLIEHNTRPTSGYNIAFYVILIFAIIGLMKMCS